MAVKKQPSSLRYTQRRTIPRKWIERLTDNPSARCIFPSGRAGIRGYQHFTDPTKMPFDMLTFPSVNCTVPSFDKIVPDLGKTLLGQVFTENTGINGNRETFKNLGGIEMEIRSNPSVDPLKKDIIQAYFENNVLLFTIIAGAFQEGETVTGSVSRVSGNVLFLLGIQMMLTNLTGQFLAGEIITGSVSGATATVITPPSALWHQLTENTNPLPRGAHEYYFDEWFDTLLPNSIPNSPISKNLPRLVWVNGYEDPSTHKGRVYSWTAGIGQIISLTPTTISLDPSITWRSLGFTEDAGGAVNIIVNGISHNVPTPANIDTNTLTIASTSGMSVGDTVTSKIETDVSPIPFDVCRANKNYMFYGSWRSRQLYQSNNFNHEYNYSLTNFQALNNDLTFNAASIYTGTGESVYHIVINSITPKIETQEFVPSGANGVNDLRWVTSGYTGPANVTNVYRVVITTDAEMTLDTSTGTFVDGESIVDVVSGVPVASATVVYQNNVPVSATELGIINIQGYFQNGDTVKGQTSGATGKVHDFNYWSRVNIYKNSVLVTLNSLLGGFIISGPDGLNITYGTPTGHSAGDAYILTIQPGVPDTFQWQKDGGVLSAPVSITGAYQALSDGVQIQFSNTTGHTVGDFWDITADPAVFRAWDNFYYTLPVRKPFEGYIYNLPSNFWTMDTFEEQMWVNDAYGKWSYVSTTLSANLQNETVELTPSKQAGANKVLYPYLTGHMENDMVYITTNRTLDNISRQLMKEKPQIGYLSDPVKLDFDTSSFVGGRIKYHKKRLYISSPENALTHVYDNFKGYWQPPKYFPEVGILSTFGEDLICHSNTRNQSFSMFTNTAGDNGFEYTVNIRTPYVAPNGTWKSTFSSMSFIEGYITGNPKLIHSAFLGVSGCGGTFPHPVVPVVCVQPDRAPFGEGSFGSHPNGSDVGVPDSYFNEIYKAYAPILSYYWISYGVRCTAKSHTWSLLSLGMNEMGSPSGNNPLVNPDNKVPNLNP